MPTHIETHWTSISGIPCVWTEDSEPFVVGLLPRVGAADETLVRAEFVTPELRIRRRMEA